MINSIMSVESTTVPGNQQTNDQSLILEADRPCLSHSCSSPLDKMDILQSMPSHLPHTKRGENTKSCVVCNEDASGMYFGALVCLPCKSFFIRSTKDGTPSFTCLVNSSCDVTHGNRLRCQYCRFKKCLKVGMCRKEKPEIVQPAEGQVLCRVCHDIANGVHFGVPTCEGCKKFFRRALKESNTYFCKYDKCCTMNPRNRNSCRYCRYQMCINVGMSRNAIRMGRPKKLSVKHLKRSISMAQYDKMKPIFKNHEVEMDHTQDDDQLDTIPNLDNRSSSTDQFQSQSTEKCWKTLGPDRQNCIQENFQPRANMAERSVIQSCGNPPCISLPQFGDIVNRGFSYMTDSLINQKRNNQSNVNEYCSGSSSSNSSGDSQSGECSPCDDSESFSSSESNKDTKNNMMDMGDDLREIMSTLTQYQNPSVSLMGHLSGYDTSNAQDIMDVTNIYKSCGMNQTDLVDKLETILKQEPLDIQDICQYNERNSEISTMRYSRDVICAYDNIMKGSEGNGSDHPVPEHAQTSHPALSQDDTTMTDNPMNQQAGLPQSNNLFTQMYNSLLLTYNVNSYGDMSPEENKYTPASFINTSTSATSPLYT